MVCGKVGGDTLLGGEHDASHEDGRGGHDDEGQDGDHGQVEEREDVVRVHPDAFGVQALDACLVSLVVEKRRRIVIDIRLHLIGPVAERLGHVDEETSEADRQTDAHLQPFRLQDAEAVDECYLKDAIDAQHSVHAS